MDYLERLGGDTNQVGRNTSRVEGTTTSFDGKGGEATNKVVHSRGLILYRQIDGFRFPGNSLSIEFDNQEKISNLEMTWKKLVPHHAYAVGSKDKMMAWIKAGKAVTLTPIEPLPQVKQLIVSDANLFYKLVGVRPSDAVVVPVVDLEFAAERASGDAITFHLHCAAVDLDERTN